jgi:type IV pilus assembly protein PilA
MKKKGFTLIELVVVMAIIAVLAVIIIGAIVVARNTATETTNRANANILRTALESYYSRYKVYCGATISGAVPVDCTTSYTFTTLSTQLNAAGITVNLNATSSNTFGGLVVNGNNSTTAGSLTAQAAYLAPYTSGNVAMPTIKLP